MYSWKWEINPKYVLNEEEEKIDESIPYTWFHVFDTAPSCSINLTQPTDAVECIQWELLLEKSLEQIILKEILLNVFMDDYYLPMLENMHITFHISFY